MWQVLRAQQSIYFSDVIPGTHSWGLYQLEVEKTKITGLGEN